MKHTGLSAILAGVAFLVLCGTVVGQGQPLPFSVQTGEIFYPAFYPHGVIRHLFSRDEPACFVPSSIEASNFREAWAKGWTGWEKRIGVADTGIYAEHQEFQGKVVGQKTYFTAPREEGIPLCHGTLVAGMAAAKGIQTAGAAPYSFLVDFTAAANTTDAQIVQLIGDAKGVVSVLNWSCCPPNTYDKGLQSALNGAMAGGPVSCIAAGNDAGTGFGGRCWSMAMQSSPHAITVAAATRNDVLERWVTDRSYTRASYSNYGSCVFLTVPDSPASGLPLGVQGRGSPDLYTPPGIAGGIGRARGTTLTAPVVSGAIAIATQRAPYLNTRLGKHLLRETCDTGDLGMKQGEFSPEFGFGRLNATALAKAVLGYSGVTPLEANDIPVNLTKLPTVDWLWPADPKQVIRDGFEYNPPGSGRRLEEVQIKITMACRKRGDVAIDLKSPRGTVSRLMYPAPADDGNSLEWTFLSNAFWGEDPAGRWELSVTGLSNVTNPGTFGEIRFMPRMGRPVRSDGLALSQQLQSYLWSAPASWENGSIPNSIGAVVCFGDNGSDCTVTLDDNETVGALNIESEHGYAFVGTGVLAFDSDCGEAVVNASGPSGQPAHVIGARVQLACSLTINQERGSLSFDGNIAGPGGLTLCGTQVALNGHNTYAGPTRIVTGILRAKDGEGLPACSTLLLDGGVLESDGNFVRTVGGEIGQVQWTGHSGFAAYAGKLSVNLGNDLRTLIWDCNGFVPDGSCLVLGSPTADNVTEFQNPIDLHGAARTVAACDNPDSNGDYAILSGRLTGSGLSGLVVDGGGTLVISDPNNDYAGPTWVVGGSTLRLGAAEVIPNASDVSVWSTLDLDGHNETVGSLSGDGNVILGSGTLTVGASDRAYADFSGRISGTGGVTKTGTGKQVLSGTDAYSGPTTITGGVLCALDGNGVPSGSNLVLNGGVFESSGSFTRSLGTGAGQVQWAGSGGFCACGGKFTVNIDGNDPVDGLVWGGTQYFVTEGNALVFGSGTADSEVEFRNPIDLNGGVRTITVNDNPEVSTDLATLSGVLSGDANYAASGLTKNGAGTLLLKAANTYRGLTTVAAGTLRYGTNDALADGNVTVAGGTLDIGAYSDAVGAVTLTGGSIIGTGGVLTASSFDVRDGTISANLDGNGADLAKTTAGTVILSGSNTYSGSTRISGGTLRADDGNGLPSASNLVLDGGVLEGTGGFIRSLGTGPGQVRWTAAGGFSAYGGKLTVNIDGNDPADTLVWGGTQDFVPDGNGLIFGSTSADSETEFRNPIDLNGAMRTIRVTDNAGSGGGFATLSGALSGDPNNTGSGLIKDGTGTLVLGSAANSYRGATRIQEGALRINEPGALPETSNLVLSGGVLEGYGEMTFSRSLGTEGNQVRWAGDGGFSAHGGKMTVGILDGNGALADLTWGAGSFVGDGNALIFGSATANDETDFQNSISLNGAARTVGVIDNPNSGDDVARFSGALSGDSNSGLVKTGGGVLVLSGSNGYAGPTTIRDGALRALDGNGLPNASNVVLDGGVLEGIGATTFSRSLGTEANQVRWTGSGGFSANGGKMTVTILDSNGVLAPLTWGAGGFAGDGNSLVLGSAASSDSETDFQNPIQLSGAPRTVVVNDNPHSEGDSATLSGVLSGDANGGLTKAGTGLLRLTAINTFGGPLTIQQGTLAVSDVFGDGNNSSLGARAGVLVIGSSTSAAMLQYTGDANAAGNSILRNVTLGQAGGHVEVIEPNACLAMAGVIGGDGGLTTTGQGTLALANSGNNYAGATIVSSGTLRLDGSEVIPDTSGLTVTGVLDLNGCQETIDRLMGSGTVKLDTTMNYESEDGNEIVAVPGSLTVGANNGTGAVFSGKITGTGSFAKVGIGTQTISNTGNDYVGSTAVWAGTLRLGNSEVIPNGSDVVVVGTLDLNDCNETIASLNGTGAVTLGSATLTVDANGEVLGAFSGTISGAGGLTKKGPGTQVLSGSNTYSGATVLSAGVLRANDGNGLPNASNLVLGGVLEGIGSAAFARGLGTNGNQVRWAGDGGFSACGGKLTVNIDGNATPQTLTWGSTQYFVGAGNALILGSSSADSETEFRNPINLNGTVRTITVIDNPDSNGDFATLSGKLSNGGLVMNGAGLLALSGNSNDYAGATTISAGTLRANDGAGLPNASNLTLNGGVLESDGNAGFTRWLGTEANQVRWTGSGGFSAHGGNLTVNIGGNGEPNTLTWAAQYFVSDGNALVFGSPMANGETEFRNSINLNGAARTITVIDNPDSNGDLVILSGRLTNGGLIKNGEGALVLANPANDYVGATMILAGTVRSAEANVIPDRSTVTVDGTLDLDGHGETVCGLNGVGQVLLGSATLTIDANGGSEAWFSGSISGTGGLIKAGGGTQTFDGANDYSGPTTIAAGVLRTQSAHGLSQSSNMVLGGGVIEGSQTFIRSLGTDGNQVRWTGSGGFSAFGGRMTVNIDGNMDVPSTLTWDANGFVPAGSSLVLGSVTADDETDFQNPIDLGDGNRTITVIDNPDSGWDFASLSGVLSGPGGIIKAGPGTLALKAANAYTGLTAVSQGVLGYEANDAIGSGNVLICGGTLDIGIYRDTVGVVTLDGGSIIGTTGILTGGSYDVRSGAISAKLDGNGVALTKTTDGLVTLGGANTYSGATTISGGALRARDSVGLPSASNLVLNGGVLEDGNTTFTRGLGTGADQVRWTGSGGFSAYGAKLTVNIDGNATSPSTLTWADGNFVPGGSALILGSTTATHETEFRNPIDLNGASRTVTVNDDPTSAGDFATLSGSLTNGGLTKDGAGLLVLGGTNTYTGATTISGGALRAGDGSGLPNASNLVLDGGVLEAGGSFARALGTDANQVRWAGGGGFAAHGGKLTVNIDGNSTPQTLTWGSGNFVPAGSSLVFGSSSADSNTEFRNPISLGSGTRTITVDDNPGSTADFAILSGQLSGDANLVKNGAGRLVLTAINTFGGDVTIDEGILAAHYVSDDGNTSLGAGTGAIRVGSVSTSAALEFTGGGGSTSRGILLGSAGGSIDVTEADADLTLTGQVAGSGGLTKAGAGTLVLSGSGNTYAGDTTILAGTIKVGDANQISAGTLAISATGKLHLALPDGAMITFAQTFRPMGGRSADANRPGTILVDANVTAVFTGSVDTVGNVGSLIGKEGDGTLKLQFPIAAVGSSPTQWGLRLSGGVTEISQLPMGGDPNNGGCIFDGGTLKLHYEPNALTGSSNYGFYGFSVTAGKTSTLQIDSNAVFQTTGNTSAPFNDVGGALIIQGADETATFRIKSGIAGAGQTGGGTIDLRGGTLTFTDGNTPTLPSSTGFTLKLNGGLFQGIGSARHDLSGSLAFNDADSNGLARFAGDWTIKADGNTSWAGTAEKVGSGAVSLNRTGGTVHVEPNALLKVSAGTLNAGGSADPFTDGGDPNRHVSVLNNAAFNVTSGVKHVGRIYGTGTTGVSSGATLNVGAVGDVTQYALSMATGSTVNIAGTLKVDGNMTVPGSSTLTVGNGVIAPNLSVFGSASITGASTIGTYTNVMGGSSFTAGDLNTTTFNVGASSSVGAISGGPASSTNVGTGVTLTANHIRHDALSAQDAAVISITVNGGDSGTSVVKALDLGQFVAVDPNLATSTLDLNDNDLIVRYQPGNSPLAKIDRWITQGFNGGDWLGQGITSTAAANDANGGSSLTALGFADNAQGLYGEFSGQTLDGNEILVKYTYYGDADLNGAVNTDDFALWAAGYAGDPGTSPTWYWGDFDYNDAVNTDDYALWAYAYEGQGGSLSMLPGGFFEELFNLYPDLFAQFFPDAYAQYCSQIAAQSAASAPEPGTLALLVLGTTAILTRRRRRG